MYSNSIFDFLSPMGPIRVVLASIILLAGLISIVPKPFIKEKLQLIFSDRDFGGEFQNKILYIETLTDELYLTPPYGDIMVFDLEKRKKIRLNQDRYYDASPSYSKTGNCIYFESKRSDRAKYELMSSPSDLYKYDLETKKILNARSDIEFALNFDESSIENPLVSKYNDSLIAFFEVKGIDQKLIICNYVSKRKLFEKKIEYNTRSKIKLFLEEYIVVFDASRSLRGEVGVYFISLIEDNKIMYLSKEFKDDFYFIGETDDGSNYYLTNRLDTRNLTIYSFNTDNKEITKEKYIPKEEITYNGIRLLELAIFDKSFLFLKEYIDTIGFTIFIYKDNNLQLLFSAKNKNMCCYNFYVE